MHALAEIELHLFAISLDVEGGLQPVAHLPVPPLQIQVQRYYELLLLLVEGFSDVLLGQDW